MAKCAYTLYLFFLLGLLPQMLSAQQEPQYTQYMYNTLTVNPGYTGSSGNLEALLQHRTQWVGIDGAPQTQAFTVHSPFYYEKLGIGLSVINDRLGPAGEVYADANISYSIFVGRTTKLAFGLKAGARMLSIDWARGRAYDEGDPLLQSNFNNRINPTIGSGLYVYDDKWYAGLSVPNFIRHDQYDDIQEDVISSRMHYYIIGGYVFDITDNLKFKPAVLGKIVSGAPITADFSANFLFQQMVTLGASYRWDDSVSALAGFQITKSIFAGYSYDYSVTELNKYNDGSHEFILRFTLFPKTSRIKSPRFF